MKGKPKMQNCQNNMYSARQTGNSVSRTAQPARNAGFCGNRGNVRRSVPVPQSSASSRYRQDDCGSCRSDSLRGMPLAMAYVPWQLWQNLYEPCRALERGTIFEDLDKPLRGKGGRCQ